MADRPIIFSAPMILALLDGRKTMTRRLAWRRDPKWGDARPVVGHEHDYMLPSVWQRVKSGDKLWAKETFFHHREKYKDSSTGFVDWVHYRATDEDDFLPGMKWTPSIYMPRVHSRLTLIVTAVKMERLQAISQTDAIAEGLIRVPLEDRLDIKYEWQPYPCGTSYPNPVGAFEQVWVLVNGAESWDANPEVVAVSFEVQKRNIDAI